MTIANMSGNGNDARRNASNPRVRQHWHFGYQPYSASPSGRGSGRGLGRGGRGSARAPRPAVSEPMGPDDFFRLRLPPGGFGTPRVSENTRIFKDQEEPVTRHGESAPALVEVSSVTLEKAKPDPYYMSDVHFRNSSPGDGPHINFMGPLEGRPGTFCALADSNAGIQSGFEQAVARFGRGRVVGVVFKLPGPGGDFDEEGGEEIPEQTPPVQEDPVQRHPSPVIQPPHQGRPDANGNTVAFATVGRATAAAEEGLNAEQQVVDATQEGITATQQALAAREEDLAATHQAIVAKEEALVAMEKALAVEKRAYADAQAALAAEKQANADAQEALNATQQAIDVKQKDLATTKAVLAALEADGMPNRSEA